MISVPLADITYPAGRSAGAETGLPVYSVTKHSGFMPSLEYFKKQVFSRDVSGYKLVEPGDFAYATIHLDEGSIGVAPQRALISPMYTVFKIDQSRVDPRYLIRFLKSPRALAHYPQLGRGAVHRRKAISLAALGALSVPLPPLPEQRRIAAILEQADALRAKRRQVLDHLDYLTQSIFHDMFGEPGTWHERWPMTTIGDLATAVDYGTSGKAGSYGSWPILRMGNVTDDGRLDLTDLKYIDLESSEVEKYTVRPGDMLFNRTNSKDKVGKTAVVRTDLPMALAGYLVRVRFDEAATAEYVSAYMTSRHGVAVRRKLAKTAVNQANINATEMKNIVVPAPPADIRRVFASKLAEVERSRADVLRAVASHDELFTSLQSRAFRGEL